MTTCKRCGWCCEHIMIKLNPSRLGMINTADREWMSWREIDVIKMADNSVQMVIPSICEKLMYETKDGEIIAICTIQENKPKVCRKSICPLPHLG